jgi:hypothetical protein
MMIELWMGNRVMGEEDKNNVNNTSRYGKSGAQLA